MELTGKVAVVTGSRRGLGAAIAEELSARGATVLISDLVAGPGALSATLDVTSTESWAALRDRISAEHGALDILVNNAGVSARSDLLTTTDEDWDRILRTNLWGTWTGIRTFADQLSATSGVVVNVGSIYGQTLPPQGTASPSSVAYQVSKAAVHQLTKVAAVELADKGIRVNAVLPGVFLTELLADLPPDAAAARVGGAPMNRAGDASEVARAVSFLASPSASFITGALVPVDGGYLAAS